jgi:hypothetical protein
MNYIISGQYRLIKNLSKIVLLIGFKDFLDFKNSSFNYNFDLIQIDELYFIIFKHHAIY